MKTLVVFYSRTGFTKKVALFLAKSLKADIDEIKDIKSRKGPLGYIRSGKEAMKKIIPEIRFSLDPSKYGLVVIGTPVWVWTVSSPIRAYLKENRKRIKKAAFFCTEAGSGADNAFREMQKLAGKPKSAAIFLDEEINSGRFLKKAGHFVTQLKA